MLLEIVNHQGFYKTIGEYIGTAYLFDYKFFICNQLLNIMILNINKLNVGLVFSIFSQNNACLVIAI